MIGSSLEREILGGLMIKPADIESLDLTSSDFCPGIPRTIFEAIATFWEEDHPPNISPGMLEERVGGNGTGAFVSEILLGNFAHAPETIQFQARQLRRRGLISTILKKIEGQCKSGELDLDEIRPAIEAYDRLRDRSSSESALPAGCLRTGTELQALELEKDEIIDKVFHARSISVLAGPGGTGKSTFMFGAGKAISRGDEFLGLRTVRTPVIFIDYENPLGLLIDRTRKLDVQDPFFWHLSAPTPPPKLDAPGWELFKRLPAGALLVFDTLRAAHDGDENSSQDMSLVLSRLKELRELGFTIVLIHHSPKGNERIYRGSTAISDLADHVLRLYRSRGNTLKEAPDQDESDENSTFVLCTGKTRYEPFHLYLSFDPEAGVFARAEDPKAAYMDQLEAYIAGEGLGKKQSDLVAWANEELHIRKRDTILAMLKRGEGSRWRSHRGFQNARIYEPL